VQQLVDTVQQLVDTVVQLAGTVVQLVNTVVQLAGTVQQLVPRGMQQWMLSPRIKRRRWMQRWIVVQQYGACLRAADAPVRCMVKDAPASAA
jgi:hypothetical protein